MHPFYIKITNCCLAVLVLIALIPSVKGQTDKSLLYKIEGKGIKPSYLFGTFHLIPQNEFTLSNKVKIAFDMSEQIVFELDMDDPELREEMMENIQMEGNVTLDSLFNPKEYAQLDASLKETMGTGIAPFNKWKPFAITSMLWLKYLGEQPASFELTLVQMAAAEEREIVGLESVKDQLAVFDKIPYQDQADDIIEMLEDPEGTADIYTEMIEAYKREELAELYNIMQKISDPIAMRYMVLQRNKNWIPKIGELAKDKSTFFGVGAGHLGGDQGVVALLKNEGYNVTPVL